LAYADVFYYCAIVAFIVAPFCLILSPKTGGGAPGGAH
jgi:DHA2 family multidrug resistance protein